MPLLVGAVEITERDLPPARVNPRDELADEEREQGLLLTESQASLLEFGREETHDAAQQSTSSGEELALLNVLLQAVNGIL